MKYKIVHKQDQGEFKVLFGAQKHLSYLLGYGTDIFRIGDSCQIAKLEVRYHHDLNSHPRKLIDNHIDLPIIQVHFAPFAEQPNRLPEEHYEFRHLSSLKGCLRL